MKAHIPADDQQSIPLHNGYVLRNLRRDDYQKGFERLMSYLTDTGNFTENQFLQAFQSRTNCVTQVVEYEPKKELAASVTLVIEQKYLHGCRCVGHIEDVVTHVDHRRQGLVKSILESLTGVARDMGCYKLILDCKTHNIPVYEKCGWRQTDEIQMRLDIPQSKM